MSNSDERMPNAANFADPGRPTGKVLVPTGSTMTPTGVTAVPIGTTSRLQDGSPGETALPANTPLPAGVDPVSGTDLVGGGATTSLALPTPVAVPVMVEDARFQRVDDASKSWVAEIAKSMASPRGQLVWGLPTLAISIVIYWMLRKKMTTWPWYARWAAFFAIWGLLNTSVALASYALPGGKDDA